MLSTDHKQEVNMSMLSSDHKQEVNNYNQHAQ
jgi:hypothetical protein